jgi:zinc D-Ala-D-Ala carboxypeptidase
MKLTENFSLQEMIKSQTAERKGIDNKPSDPSAITNLQTLCEKVLQPVRDHYGRPVVINSGYRSPKLNKAIGSSSKSQHTKGEAADIEIPGVSNKELAEYIRDNLGFDQLILEFYNGVDPQSGWVHVSYVDDNSNRKQTLTINKNGTFAGFV